MQLDEWKEADITRPGLHATMVDGKRLNPVVADPICADHGCDLVHPGTTHDAYDARFHHARACQVCCQVSQHTIAPEAEGGLRPPRPLGLRCGSFVAAEGTG
jgi:hypothetical protein